MAPHQPIHALPKAEALQIILADELVAGTPDQAHAHVIGRSEGEKLADIVKEGGDDGLFRRGSGRGHYGNLTFCKYFVDVRDWGLGRLEWGCWKEILFLVSSWGEILEC